MNRAKAKKITGAAVKGVLALVVLAYLGLHTINFFMYTFPPEQWYLSWLGFGLTGGGLIGYLIVFLWEADTDLKKWVALVMTVVCGLGEVLAAGFGMQIEAWVKSGFTLTESDFNMMLMAVRLLAFLHFLALVVYTAGDKIGEMFGDDDSDGTPNYRDPDYKPRKQQPKPQPVYNQTTPAPQHTLDEFLSIAGITKDQARVKFADRDTFMAYASGQFDYISGGNMRRLYGELMNGNPTVAARSNHR